MDKMLNDEEVNRLCRESLDFAGIGLCRYLCDGTIVFIDRGAVRILDLEDEYPDPASLKGKNVSDLVQYIGPEDELRGNILKAGHARNLEFRFKTLKGEERVSLHDSYVMYDPETNEKSIQLVVRDITELKRNEEELKAAKREADFYLDLMSHDLTNYYQTILGNLNLLERRIGDDEVAKKYIDTLIRQVAKGENLLGKVRALSQLEGIRDELLHGVDIDKCLETAVKAVKVLYPLRNTKFEYESGVDRWAIGTDHLSLIFTIIIENAVKHGYESAFVKIEVDESKMMETPAWEIRIIDNGPGIPGQVLENLFERFPDRAAAGFTGLGLWLAKSLVEKFGGEIKVGSATDGVGAAVIIKLKRAS